jgi:hypothetical protein
MSTTICIFIASPGDVGEDRNTTSDIINNINSTLSAITPELGTLTTACSGRGQTTPLM